MWSKLIDLQNSAIVMASVLLGFSMWNVLDVIQSQLNISRWLGIVLYFLVCGVVLSLIRPRISLLIVPIIYTSGYIAAYFLFPDPMFVGDAIFGFLFASVGFSGCALIWGVWRFWNPVEKRERSKSDGVTEQ